MFSKPVAALLLVIAIFGAAVGGAYIALQVFQPGPDDPSLELPDDGLSTGDPEAGAATGAGAARQRPTPQTRSGTSRPGPGTAPGPTTGGPASGPTAPLGSAATGAPNATGGTAARENAPPADPVFEEVEVPTNTLLPIKLQAPLTSESAKVEDRVEARITKDVAVRGIAAIPAGTLVVGSVTDVNKGGPMSERARLDVKFHTLKIPHAPDVPIIVDVIPQEGPSPTKGTKGRVAGGAAGGAALGWLKGGLSGAITGGAIGGGAGVGARIVEGRQPAEIPAGAETQIQLRAPAFVTVQR